MNGEGIFRWLFLAGMLAGGAIGAYHRTKAWKAGGSVSRRKEGLAMFLALRLAGLVGWLGLIAWLIEPDWLAWFRLPIPDGARWLGAILGLAVIAWVYWTLSHLGTNLTDTVATRTEHTLVTTGPYAWVRHPFYVAILMFVVAGTLLASNGFIALAGLVTFALIAVRARQEEAELIARFGDRYRDYAARTGRYVPRLRRR
jgi:protein-S-isoprenylcysteine O-methyltransferase Ste14